VCGGGGGGEKSRDSRDLPDIMVLKAFNSGVHGLRHLHPGRGWLGSSGDLQTTSFRTHFETFLPMTERLGFLLPPFQLRNHAVRRCDRGTVRRKCDCCCCSDNSRRLDNRGYRNEHGK
jgi:hypothetical protein